MFDTSALMNDLRKRVELNRQLGRYPVGLEEQLEADFRAIMEVVHGTEDFDGFRSVELEAIKTELIALKSSFSSARTRKSGFPIEGQILAVIERCVTIVESAHKEIKQIREEDTRVLRKMNSYVMDRLGMIDVLAQAVVELERKLADK